MKRSLIALSLVLATACATSPHPAGRQPVHVVIVGTTDVHGSFATRQEKSKQGESYQRGGLALFGGYVAALRRAYPGHVLLVDSGDLFQGTLESNLFEGEPVIHAYDALGYTAAAVGNHEFDYGPEGPDSTVTKAGEDPLGALEKNIARANFPFLAANIVDAASGRIPPWVKPSVVVNVDGAKIGIIGLAAPDTPTTTVPSNVVGLRFTDPVAATTAEAARLRAAGADAVVVIAHIGGRCTDLADVHDVASCDADTGAMHYLQALPPGTIDAYFGGHTHQQMREIVNGIPALQSAPYSEGFSSIDLWVDPGAHRVIADRTHLREQTMLCSSVWSGTEKCDPRSAPPDAHLASRTFEGSAIVRDEQIVSILQPYLDRTSAKKNEKTGITTAVAFTRQYRMESPLGDLVTDGLRDATGADVAVANSGGIRTNLRAGELTYDDFFRFSPFDDYPVVVTMTGAQITEMLNVVTHDGRGILQISGLHYAFDEKRPQSSRVTSVTREDGTPLDPNATLRVAMTGFLAGGGEGLDAVMKQIPPERFSSPDSRPIREHLIEALKKWPMPVGLRPGNRITVMNPKPEGE